MYVYIFADLVKYIKTNILLSTIGVNESQAGLETPGCGMEPKAFHNTHDLI